MLRVLMAKKKLQCTKINGYHKQRNRNAKTESKEMLEILSLITGSHS